MESTFILNPALREAVDWVCSFYARVDSFACEKVTVYLTNAYMD
jgi:hypothetical protein